MSIKWDKRFLSLAKLVAGWSKDPSTQVGAVLVNEDKRVISLGFNGFPQKMPDVGVLYEERTEKYSRIIHAEINALIFAGQLPPRPILYTWPFMPCDRCVVQLIQAGVTHFVAPKADKEAEGRWGAAFDKTRQYIRECELTLREYDQ